jgi:UDP-GlcNAc:undecaprenyl-phosphate/decaprenyl-phosphate GlcNAc-1-phosphate transferase
VNLAGALGRLALGVGVGFLGTRLFWMLLRPTLAGPVFSRSNYRQQPIATAGGICIIGSVLIVESLRALTGVAGWGKEFLSDQHSVLTLAFGFGLLGLIDDLGAEGAARGFRGHLRALKNGSLTTGGLKLVGGGLLAVTIASVSTNRTGGYRVGTVLLDALTIALAANLANLFDRAPGRTTKVSTLVFLVLVFGVAALGSASVGLAALTGSAVVIGAALGLLPEELREHVMLGDTGSNVIGAVVGFGFTLAASVPTRAIAAIVLILLNVSSELFSFSRVIEAVRPFRWFDRLGRPDRD